MLCCAVLIAGVPRCVLPYLVLSYLIDGYRYGYGSRKMATMHYNNATDVPSTSEYEYEYEYIMSESVS